MEHNKGGRRREGLGAGVPTGTCPPELSGWDWAAQEEMPKGFLQRWQWELGHPEGLFLKCAKGLKVLCGISRRESGLLAIAGYLSW